MPIHLDSEGSYFKPIKINSNCQMIEQAGPTAIGSNQVTQVLAPTSNTKGFKLKSFYTQVVQASSSGNIAQSLIVCALTAPTSFVSKQNCFALYRTYQSDKYALVCLDGFAPANIYDIEFPANWGIWQICNVVGVTLDRNNMRFSLEIY